MTIEVFEVRHYAVMNANDPMYRSFHTDKNEALKVYEAIGRDDTTRYICQLAQYSEVNSTYLCFENVENPVAWVSYCNAPTTEAANALYIYNALNIKKVEYKKLV